MRPTRRAGSAISSNTAAGVQSTITSACSASSASDTIAGGRVNPATFPAARVRSRADTATRTRPATPRSRASGNWRTMAPRPPMPTRRSGLFGVTSSRLAAPSAGIRALQDGVEGNVAGGGQILGFAVLRLVVADAPLTGREDHRRRGDPPHVDRVVAGAPAHTHVVVTEVVRRLRFRERTRGREGK